LDAGQKSLNPALGAALSASSKIFCQKKQQFHDLDTNIALTTKAIQG
jgi:hypothetical protein